jgi:hypothetical protein
MRSLMSGVVLQELMGSGTGAPAERRSNAAVVKRVKAARARVDAGKRATQPTCS